MVWNELHSSLLSQALEKMLGRPEQDPSPSSAACRPRSWRG